MKSTDRWCPWQRHPLPEDDGESIHNYVYTALGAGEETGAAGGPAMSTFNQPLVSLRRENWQKLHFSYANKKQLRSLCT